MPTPPRLDDVLRSAHAAVIGLQWGDEGKGQLVDILADRADVVVRFNGGNNAGHSVRVGSEKFALHLLPSGVIHPGKLNVIGNGVVVDPSPQTGLLKEIDALLARHIDVTDRLLISSRAHVVMPYHKREDALREAAARGDQTDGSIGTTGRGIGPCYADKALRATAIRMGDLLKPDLLAATLRKSLPVKNATLAALAQLTHQPHEPLVLDALLEQLRAWAHRLGPMITDTRQRLHHAQAAGKRILFEGANAALLDVDHGTYPFVTSSTTTALGIGQGTGLPTTQMRDVIGVVKAYTSRVGSGPHPTELTDERGDTIRRNGNEFGTTTGRPRRCGWLDLTAVRYSAQLAGATGLVITGLSVLAGLPELRVNVGYTLHGSRTDRFPVDADDLAAATPELESLTPYHEPLAEVRRYADLPAAAQAYVDRIEQFVGVPVIAACVGPARDQILPR